MRLPTLTAAMLLAVAVGSAPVPFSSQQRRNGAGVGDRDPKTIVSVSARVEPAAVPIETSLCSRAGADARARSGPAHRGAVGRSFDRHLGGHQVLPGEPAASSARCRRLERVADDGDRRRRDDLERLGPVRPLVTLVALVARRPLEAAEAAIASIAARTAPATRPRLAELFSAPRPRGALRLRAPAVTPFWAASRAPSSPARRRRGPRRRLRSANAPSRPSTVAPAFRREKRIYMVLTR